MPAQHSTALTHTHALSTNAPKDGGEKGAKARTRKAAQAYKRTERVRI